MRTGRSGPVPNLPDCRLTLVSCPLQQDRIRKSTRRDPGGVALRLGRKQSSVRYRNLRRTRCRHEPWAARRRTSFPPRTCRPASDARSVRPWSVRFAFWRVVNVRRDSYANSRLPLSARFGAQAPNRSDRRTTEGSARPAPAAARYKHILRRRYALRGSLPPRWMPETARFSTKRPYLSTISAGAPGPNCAPGQSSPPAGRGSPT